ICIVRAVLQSVLLFIGSTAVHGQTNVGSIFGRVSDSSGGAIAGASVLLVNPATNEKLTVVTSETGDYVFNLVRPATYDMSASFAGFKTVQRSGIVLQVAEKLGIDLTLEPGEITQKVEVHGEAPLLQPGSSDIGTVINSRTIVDLPLEGRNVYQLVTLVP